MGHQVWKRQRASAMRSSKPCDGLHFIPASRTAAFPIFPYRGAALILGGLATVSADRLAGAELVANTAGAVARYSLLAVGMMNAVMVPATFSLACEKLGPCAADGSGIIDVAICGRAIIPPLLGALAAATSLALALCCHRRIMPSLPESGNSRAVRRDLFARRPLIRLGLHHRSSEAKIKRTFLTVEAPSRL